MNRNIQALIRACERLKIDYASHHGTGNLISVRIKGIDYLFANWTTPLNSQSVVQLCQDKDYFYSFFQNVIEMPKTLSFLNPYCDEKYKEYLDHNTVFSIIESVESNFRYPVAVKKNRGSWGTNVFKANNRKELEKSILIVFDENSAAFDYVCLVQQFLDIDNEYRVIFLNGQYQFGYKKNIENAKYSGNISPLHWEGAVAELIDDATTNNLCKFCSPIFEELMIPFCGLDIAEDTKGNLWLIEANSSPGFDHVIQDNEKYDVVGELYESILKQLSENRNTSQKP